MRIVYFGTAEFAVPTLQKLLDAPDMEVVGVVTQPDRPQGRGQKLTPPPVKVLALSAGLKIFQPERLRKSPETLAELAALEAGFFVVAAYGQILPQAVLDMPKSGCINVHGSLLPKYRGAAPIHWAIYHGETETGITTMLMDAGLDTGAMLLKAVVPITDDANSEQLIQELSIVGADLLLETLHKFAQIIPEPQENDQSSYAPLIDKQSYVIDWSQSAGQIRNQVRAFYPYTYTLHKENRLRVLAAQVVDFTGNPGTVLRLTKEGVLVATGEKALELTTVQPAGGRPITGWNYANGNHLAVGDGLGE
ncbi:MAG: methionyl-tRNA formyltransferase [Anaerolineae bacterium]|nr:methionyl-tRNA formyltransferase [Gloeobacterales cyanobacterium ES-bin-313]